LKIQINFAHSFRNVYYFNQVVIVSYATGRFNGAHLKPRPCLVLV
jgi:hypothetical protein